MGKVMIHYFMTVLQVVLYATLASCFKLQSRVKRENNMPLTNVTVLMETTTASNTTAIIYANHDGARIGLVVGVICGVLAAIVAMAIVVTVWIRNKRNRDSEYERAAKVQRNSTLSAGVYNDLTTNTPIVKMPMEILERDITEMEKLRPEGDEEMA